MKTKSLNPQFARRLPEIVDGLLAAMVAIRQPLAEAGSNIQELTEYLDFEISKTHLALTAADADRPRLQKWLDHLRMIKAIATPAEMAIPGTAMRELVDQLQESFTGEDNEDHLFEGVEAAA